MTINFASENYAGVHPTIMQALAAANQGSAPSYGSDEYTKNAVEIFKKNFGEDIDVYFTFNGTGANNFGIGAVTDKHHAVFCTDVAHLYVDESTAPEAFIGCRIYPIASANGKILPDALQKKIKQCSGIHSAQPKLVSITQPTECGTVYTIAELKAIKQICTDNNLVLHVDGARFFNAAVSLNATLKQISTDVGVDILTLGGTKSGMMFGEAVVFFNRPKPNPYKYHLKRSMQLASKNRFIAAQFTALLSDDLWKHIATHTNQLALTLEQALAGIIGVEVLYPVETNAVFVKMPKNYFDRLSAITNFYCWNEEGDVYRLMLSFNSKPEDVTALVDELKQIAQQ